MSRIANIGDEIRVNPDSIVAKNLDMFNLILDKAYTVSESNPQLTNLRINNEAMRSTTLFDREIVLVSRAAHVPPPTLTNTVIKNGEVQV